MQINCFGSQSYRLTCLLKNTPFFWSVLFDFSSRPPRTFYSEPETYTVFAKPFLAEWGWPATKQVPSQNHIIKTALYGTNQTKSGCWFQVVWHLRLFASIYPKTTVQRINLYKSANLQIHKAARTAVLFGCSKKRSKPVTLIPPNPTNTKRHCNPSCLYWVSARHRTQKSAPG